MPATLLIALGVGATGSFAALGSCLLCALRGSRSSEPKPPEQVTEETSLLGSSSQNNTTAQLPQPQEQPDLAIKPAPREIQHSLSPSVDTIKPPTVSPKILVSPPPELSKEPTVTFEELPSVSAEQPSSSQIEPQEEIEKDIPETHSLETASSATVTPGFTPELAQHDSPPDSPIQANPEPITPTEQSKRNSRVSTKKKNKFKGKGRNKRAV